MNLRILLEKYERFFSPLVFIIGFMLDSLTLTRIDLWIDHVVLAVYLITAGAGIFLVNAYYSGKLRLQFLENYAPFLSIPIQFAFGGLFSGFFIFYSRSASLVSSLPFLAFLAFILVGNEFFRKRYAHFVFQVSIFFIALLSYSIFALPVFIGRMGPYVFLLSGLVSLILLAVFIFSMSVTVIDQLEKYWKYLLGSVGSIYIFFNISYFVNIIPPIPLSLKEVGVYHSVVRTDNEYVLLFEPAPKYLFSQNYSSIFHIRPGEPAYIYSAVFAPTRLYAKIFHRWSRFDEVNNRWVETDRIQFPIIGGRDGGYRGFTFKQNVAVGNWRIDVITERGQLLGRLKFKVVPAEAPPDLRAIRS